MGSGLIAVRRMVRRHFGWFRPFACIGEWLWGGGKLRERILLKMLGAHYRSRMRRQWLWQCAGEPPHFTDHQSRVFCFAFERSSSTPYFFYRGFFNSELVREGDRLLDIGCGDGFFTKRFFAPGCSRVDGVDIEPSAISSAKRYNSAGNISFHLMDAVAEPFPDDRYDVIVWDGALGHFSPETTHRMLGKIKGSLSPQGIFGGSESLGFEGDDHLQFFHSLEDLSALFKPHFRYVQLRSATYRVGLTGQTVRHEAYWRCANNPERLEESGWKSFFPGEQA